ncbi:unnamed protein product [Cladocopium goreaui]|uniref:Uncharacterized protein n=1 Tax=Cladocopium goreaui TaxID=2562237 RepID=A0A9P1CT59_9DINO|nr:unnamed protein product [Cladocopium goreaui]
MYYIYICAQLKSAGFLSGFAFGCEEKDSENATKAIQAVNDAWAVLRDQKSRQAYNQRVVADALSEESKFKKSKSVIEIAAAAKAAAKAAVKAKAKSKAAEEVHMACGKASSSSSKGPDASKSSTAPSASSSGKTPSWVYCMLTEQKTVIVCKSQLSKGLQRRFEHKAWAGSAHALRVAREFQDSCETMLTKTLSMTKLDQLKNFCGENDIKIPSGTRLSKHFLNDTIEQAFYAGSCKSIEEKLRKAYQKSTGADATTEGSATMTHGIVVDKCTNKFMATYKVSKEHGSISKIFDTRQDAEFWFDSLNALMKQGRLAGNLSALRQAAATRKATAAAINKIMEENISLEPESRDAYKREVKEGKDVFDKIFKKSSGSGLRRASVHLFKASSDQLQECAGKGVVNGVLCGSWHASLGWRPTTIIVFGSGFDKDSADAFVAKSGLTKLGVISCSDSPKPSEGDFAKFAQVAKTSECKNCVMWHLVQERFQVSSRFFQHNPDTKVPEEVSMEFISRRLNGEDVRILGLDEKVREALAAKISRPKTLRFSVGKVPPDGRCFWYSWLASVLSDEWWAIERNKTGYALNREQLLTEENMGQRLLDEVMDKMISIASTDEALASYEDVKESKQMTLDLAHVVGLAFGCRFRISLAENAQKDDYPADAMYGQPDGPVVGHFYFRYLQKHVGHFDVLREDDGKLRGYQLMGLRQ